MPSTLTFFPVVARVRGLPGSFCGRWPVSDGGLRADHVVVDRVHIHSCGYGGWRVCPFRGPLFFFTPQKVSKKRLAQNVRPLAWARRSFAPVSIRGHCPPVCFATTYMQRVRLRRTAAPAPPRMNTSTQPPDGAGGSRSRAAGELTLGLMSGENQKLYAEFL